MAERIGLSISSGSGPMRASEWLVLMFEGRRSAACRSTGNAEGRLLSGCLALHSRGGKAGVKEAGWVGSIVVERLRVDNGERPASATESLHAESTGERKEQVGAGGGVGGGAAASGGNGQGSRRPGVGQSVAGLSNAVKELLQATTRCEGPNSAQSVPTQVAP